MYLYLESEFEKDKFATDVASISPRSRAHAVKTATTTANHETAEQKLETLTALLVINFQSNLPSPA